MSRPFKVPNFYLCSITFSGLVNLTANLFRKFSICVCSKYMRGSSLCKNLLKLLSKAIADWKNMRYISLIGRWNDSFKRWNRLSLSCSDRNILYHCLILCVTKHTILLQNSFSLSRLVKPIKQVNTAVFQVETSSVCKCSGTFCCCIVQHMTWAAYF